MGRPTSAFAIAASAARTADFTSAEFSNASGRALIFVSVTAISATPSVVPKLQVYNVVTDTWETVGTFAALTAVVERIYHVGNVSAGTATDNIDEFLPVALPDVWRMFMDHADADSITYDLQGLYTG